MAKGAPAASSPPPTATPPSSRALKRTTSSTQNMKSQKSILGFFQKSSPSTPSTARKVVEPASSPAERASIQRAGADTTTSSTEKKKPLQPQHRVPHFKQDLTPVPSSDLVIPDEDDERQEQNAVQVWCARFKLVIECFGVTDLLRGCRPVVLMSSKRSRLRRVG